MCFFLYNKQIINPYQLHNLHLIERDITKLRKSLIFWIFLFSFSDYCRCYYRCTHRNVRGCLATKQVQKSDNDPNIFEVTYRGRHTCNQSSNLGSTSISSQNQIYEETNQIQQKPNSEIWFDFGDINFNLKTEDFDQVFPPFSFSYEEPIMNPTFIPGEDLTAAVSSPATDTAWDWSGYDGGVQRVQSSEQSAVTEIVSATTSVTNSPIYNGDWDFSLDNIDFDHNFPFDSLDFISWRFPYYYFFLST